MRIIALAAVVPLLVAQPTIASAQTSSAAIEPAVTNMVHVPATTAAATKLTATVGEVTWSLRPGMSLPRSDRRRKPC